MIGGKRVKIRVIPNLEEWGSYNYDTQVINIADRATVNPRILLSTLRHEMVHASLAISGVSFSEGFQEESICRCIDEIFFPAYERLCAKLTNTTP